MRGKALAAYESRLLLGGRWLPVTQDVAFYRASPQRCFDLMVDWRRSRYLERFGYLPAARVVHGDDLDALLHRLLPIRPVEEDKHLFVPTRHPEWTAHVSNRGQGLGAGLSWMMADRGVQAVQVCDVPRTLRQPLSGCRSLSFAQPCEPWANTSDRVQHGVTYSVRVRVQDGGRWVFDDPMCSRGDRFDDGMPEPVGKVWDEHARRVPDRLTHEHLRLACERLGLFPFEEDFYAPEGWALLASVRSERDADALPSITLAQARGEERYDG